MLGRIELLELFLRLARWTPGSDGFSPVDLANVFSTSVNETTPLSFPDIRAPIRAEAGTEAAICGDGGAAGAPCVKLAGPVNGVVMGVSGAVGDGDDDSTTHMRCDRVATSFATVWARVE